LKHSDCEIDLKFLEYSTRRRTELAGETGQDGKPEFRFPTNRRQRRNGANWRPLSRDAIRIRLAIRNFFERFEFTIRTGPCARGADGTRGYAAY